jgi:hypothetical protein
LKRFFGTRSCDANTKHCLVIVAKRIIESFDFLRCEQCETKDQSECKNVELSVQVVPSRENRTPFYFNFDTSRRRKGSDVALGLIQRALDVWARLHSLAK